MADRYVRVRAEASDEVHAAAGDYWDLLTDWPAILRWMRVEGRPVPIIHDIAATVGSRT